MIGQHDHVLWIVLTSMMKIVNDVRLEEKVQVDGSHTGRWRWSSWFRCQRQQMGGKWKGHPSDQYYEQKCTWQD